MDDSVNEGPCNGVDERPSDEGPSSMVRKKHYFISI